MKGSLREGIVLGVNDESQINNDALRKHDLFKNIFLKGNINSQMGQRRTERAEEMIDRSMVICIFGMSIGLTDKRWWEKIISWMRQNVNRKLIIYTRVDEKYLKKRIPTYIIREIEKVKRDLFKKGSGDQADTVYDDISSRIFVVFNSKIFGFPKCSNF